MLESTSGTEPSMPLHTHDATPIESKVAPRLTALQGSLITTVWRVLCLRVTTREGIIAARVAV